MTLTATACAPAGLVAAGATPLPAMMPAQKWSSRDNKARPENGGGVVPGKVIRRQQGIEIARVIAVGDPTAVAGKEAHGFQVLDDYFHSFVSVLLGSFLSIKWAGNRDEKPGIGRGIQGFLNRWQWAALDLIPYDHRAGKLDNCRERCKALAGTSRCNVRPRRCGHRSAASLPFGLARRSALPMMAAWNWS